MNTRSTLKRGSTVIAVINREGTIGGQKDGEGVREDVLCIVPLTIGVICRTTEHIDIGGTQ
jgi:hypothetical protein